MRRNACGVPVIRAESFQDAWRELGWVHARDRQLQCLLGREMLAGRMAEKLIGSPELLDMDISIRELQILPDPEEEIADLEPEARGSLQAYADGFNARLARRGAVWELRLLGYRPEPWRIEDSLLSAKCFGYMGGPTFQVAIEKLLVQMVQKNIDDGRIREIYTYLREPLDRELLGKVTLREPPVAGEVMWGGAGGSALPRASGSNNWAVSGRFTASGEPILCGDLHQEVARVPCIWQEVVLELPDALLMGATIPGVPGLIVGRSRAVAWSPTTSLLDVVDLRIEEVKGGRYRRADGWKDFTVRRERFGVKGKEPAERVFYETDRGTLEGDPAADGFYLVQDWAIRRRAAAADFNGLFRMNRARSAREAMEALRRLDGASFSWVVADVEGNIGCQMSGRTFRRPEGVGGLAALPAWEPRFDPQGFLDKDELPSAYNPPEGFICTANNDLNHLGGRPVLNIPDSPTRADRIAELLRDGGPFDVDAMKRMQYELYSPKAERFMRILRPLLPGTRNGRILKGWDCVYDLGSRGAMLFESVRRELVYLVFGEGGFGREVLEHMEKRSFLYSALAPRFDEILLAERSAWFGARSREALYRQAVERGLAVRAVPFGRTRRMTFRHLLFGGVLPSFLGFDYGPAAVPGGRDALFTGKVYGGARGTTGDAPVYRMIADLAGEDLHTNMAGGPTDRRFSRWYRGGWKRWYRGGYQRLGRPRCRCGSDHAACSPMPG